MVLSQRHEYTQNEEGTGRGEGQREKVNGILGTQAFSKCV